MEVGRFKNIIGGYNNLKIQRKQERKSINMKVNCDIDSVITFLQQKKKGYTSVEVVRSRA